MSEVRKGARVRCLNSKYVQPEPEPEPIKAKRKKPTPPTKPKGAKAQAPKKKTKPTKAASSPWPSAAKAAISKADMPQLKAVRAHLQRLTALADRRLLALQAPAAAAAGAGVLLVQSTQNLGGTFECTSRSVDAKFTAGPLKAQFSIYVSNESEEGEDSTRAEGDGAGGLCWLWEDEDFNGPEAGSIGTFLELAGLQQARPARAPAGDKGMSPEERAKWVFGDVLYEAVRLLLQKYGNDANGINLGMGEEDMYTWLGLNY